MAQHLSFENGSEGENCSGFRGANPKVVLALTLTPQYPNTLTLVLTLTLTPYNYQLNLHRRILRPLEEERPKHADVPVARLARYTAPYLVFVVAWYGTTTSFSTASKNQPDPYVRTSVK